MIVNNSYNQYGYDRQVVSELLHECVTTKSPRELCLSGLRWSNMEWDGPSWSEMVPKSSRSAKMVPVGLSWCSEQIVWDGSHIFGNDNANLGPIGKLNRGRWEWYGCYRWTSHALLKSPGRLLNGPWRYWRALKAPERFLEWPWRPWINKNVTRAGHRMIF